MAGKTPFRGLRRSISRTRKSRRQALMLGLDGAGKTTMLAQLRQRCGSQPTSAVSPSSQSHTIGFNVEGLELDGLSIACWDLGCQECIGPVWRHHVSNAAVVIIVVDASDAGRLDLARRELVGALSDRALADCRVLVAANKQDVHGALGGEEVAAALGLPGLRGHKWQVVETSAASGDGIDELVAAAIMPESSFVSSGTIPPRQEIEESFLSCVDSSSSQKESFSKAGSRWSFRIARDMQHMLSQAL